MGQRVFSGCRLFRDLVGKSKEPAERLVCVAEAGLGSGKMKRGKRRWVIYGLAGCLVYGSVIYSMADMVEYEHKEEGKTRLIIHHSQHRHDI